VASFGTEDALSFDSVELERYAQFDQLQQQLIDVWNLMRTDAEGESVVVVPSVTLDRINERGGTLTQAYEERFLFMLLLLRQPRLRMIYVTSMPIAPAIIEYYLALLPGIIPSHARSRLSLVSVDDASSKSLSEKLLVRPRLLNQIRSLVPDPTRSHLMPYNTTGMERDLALALGIPMYGADPRLVGLGTKTGCRRLFAEEGIRHPLGVEDVHTMDDVTDAIIHMRSERDSLSAVIIKLDEGVSGEGNALVDVSNLPEHGTRAEREEVDSRLRNLKFELPGISHQDYADKLAQRGGIVEERITGVDLRSPSVQLRVTPLGEVEVLSTHDQLLGGPSGQSYLGCRFPADLAYARRISEDAAIIGARLAREGVLGRFAIDFVVVKEPSGTWIPFAIEINLRKGGTTHPFLTLQFLTGGQYDANAGVFRTKIGDEKYLVATDHLESAMLRGLRLNDLFDVVVRHGLHFDQTQQTGVVFHMISCLTEHGRIGITAVGDTPEAAEITYRRAERVLLEEARQALDDAVDNAGGAPLAGDERRSTLRQ
jgi:PGM1 C-terminal domain